ncbi:MAG TPA: tetratricopeptide repeat protein [Balneolaceae bacterium]|nr:tetratricopeptide repeat protein [Balneolaceae bacterium]
MADSTGYNQRLKKGIEAFYTTHWKEAEATFKALQLENPNDSRAYFFSSMIPFWKYFFGANTKQAANLFLKRSEKAIAVSLDELNENPHDTTMVLMLSGLYGYRSLIAANESQYRTAIQSGVTGFKYTRQLLALDADDPRALIGKGVFYYMMGSVPPELRWMTNMAGLSGSKRQGFNALERAAESKSYVSNDAKMILSYLYEREGQYEKSLQNLRELGQRYPQNIIFQFNLARMLEKCNKIAEAKAKYKTVASLKNDELEVLKEKSRKRYKKL